MLRAVFRQHARLRAIPRTPIARRYFADDIRDSKNEQPKQASSAPKKPMASSLLSDDILERAGMDTQQAMERESRIQSDSSAAAEASESSSSSADSAANSGEDSAQKKWQPNARKSSDQSSTDRKREKRSNMFYAVLLGAAIGGAAYEAREWDTEHDKERHSDIGDGYSPDLCYKRAKARFLDFYDYYRDPVFDKLLPDPLPPPYGRPLTLVVAMDDFLIHSEWTREHGWRTAKRPGVDYFLGYLAQYYEIVLFSTRYQAYGEKPALQLDPYRSCFSYSLFREATRYENGKIIKDLNALNRDLGHIIMVDTKPDSWAHQPENAIKLKPWKGNADDRGLVELIPMLEWIATENVKDVRPILATFEGSEDPAKDYVVREAAARKIFEEKWYKEHASAASGSWASSFLGVKPTTPPTPMMPIDRIREEGRKGYEHFQQYLKENGEKMLAEEKAREKEFLGEQKFTLGKLVTEGMPDPDQLAAAYAEREKRDRDALEQIVAQEQKGIQEIEKRS